MLPGLIAFAAVTLVHLFAQVIAPGGTLADLTQVLLMPALAWVLMTSTRAPRSPFVRLVLLALGLSWLGDTLPRFAGDGDLAFALMLGAFLLAQLAYVAAFLPLRERSIARTRPILLLPYALALVLLIALTATGAGAALPAVILYGLVIVAMAILATGLDLVATIGAALFLLSDALIALHAFADLALPGHGFWVMLTYCLGQGLIVVAVAHHDRLTGARRT